MTNKIIVGFRTRAVPPALLEPLIPPFQANRSFKDKLKIEADLAEKRERFLANARNMPYTGTFDMVALSDPANSRVRSWTFAPAEEGDTTRPICLAVASWILEAYPDAWTADTHDSRAPRVVFLGFNPRVFLKMLGSECSLPEHGRPLPPKMWYSNSDHRDIGEAIVPSGFPDLALETALRRRRPVGVEARAKWDKLVDGWTAPHVDPIKDVLLTTELASQLGFLKGD